MTTQHVIRVENLKCGGCSSTIVRRLSDLQPVSGVAVEPDESAVSFQSPSEVVPAVRDLLEKLGYPEEGAVPGLSGLGASVRSFVSCAIGKVGARA